MKYYERVQKWNESMRATHMDADEGDGHWVTTKEGNHMFINGEGEPTKGNPHVLAAAKGNSNSGKKSSGTATKKTFKSKDHAIESLSTAEKAVNGTGERLEKKKAELKAAKEGDKGKIQKEIDRMEKQYDEESSRLFDLMKKANEEFGITSDDLPKSKGRPTEMKEVKKSNSSAKMYSVQDNKAKTNEFNKIMQGINGQEKASEMLDTLPVGTVLESETAFFRKTDDGKWMMSEDGYFLSDPAHYSPDFASMVCEAGHTNIVLPKSATEGKSSATKTAAKKEAVKPKGNEYSGREYLSRVTGNGSDSEKEYQKNFFKNASDEDKKSALELEMSSMFSAGYPSDEKMKKAVSDFKDFGVYEDFKKTYDDYFGRSGEFDRDWGHVVGDRDVPEMNRQKRSSGESKKAIKSVLDRSGFWTRDNEMEDDFNEAGFDVLENNDEYIVVSDNKSDSDTQYQMRKFRGGSSFTLEPPTAISFGGEDDDDWDDEDDEEDW